MNTTLKETSGDLSVASYAGQQINDSPWIPNQKINMREDAIAARLSAQLDAGTRPRQIAIESSVTQADLEQWIKGNRTAQVTFSLSKWLIGIDEEIAERNGEFVMTPTAERFLRAFEQARAPKGRDGRRGIALIYGASGAGKTETAKWAARMDNNVAYVQADGERKTYVALLHGILESKNEYGRPHNGEKLKDIVQRYFEPGGLFIFDHAHLIKLAVMEQLLTFPDEYGIALAFIGNTKGYRILMNAKMAQINSRIGGAQVFVESPEAEDIDALLEAWQVRGRKERDFCHLIGRQDGGLRYLDSTVQEAWKIAKGGGYQKLDEKLLKLGAVNAGCWGGTL